MAEIIRMPRMSDTMEEGNIVSWLKNEGEKVQIGETIAEVETDKATMELDSYVEGVILHIAVKEGPIAINGVIAVIGKEGEDWKAALEASGGSNGAPKTQETPAAPQPVEPTPVAAAPAQPEPNTEDRIKASPLARNIAQESGIDLRQVKGSGDSGRIIKRDVEAFLGAPATTEQPVDDTHAVIPFAPMSSSGGDNYEEKPISQMRKTIARRLSQSKFTAPHFYLTVEIDMEKAISIRKQINEVSPVKISFNDLVIKAAAASLRQHPAVNASWLEDRIRYNRDINIGVAVAVEDGLLVPVIRHADIKTLSQVNQEVKTYAEKAKVRKLQPEEMQGNTFTISNLGMFGIEEFTGIINPPDACILAVGTIVEKPVVKNGEIVIGQRMKVTLSCDHRVVDGASGARFLETMKGILEDPIRLMV
ncbi:MAG: pyruvate dehydrogenase complex dihydrolipoamide acetyltransferase [Saprospirales bacterium]|nr:pyruvate dehydrogenase complex dihydrolipoamide acetyltransferase [Saprospirales bacterium]MBK8491117.1 pyruvate dehydrogenase complex dihydrolipoamide acetyltransferase [Saprospirales bacterium]